MAIRIDPMVDGSSRAPLFGSSDPSKRGAITARPVAQGIGDTIDDLFGGEAVIEPVSWRPKRGPSRAPRALARETR